jgi:hypothetical protein
MAELVRYPISNAITGNAFTLTLSVGNPAVPVNVMLDTGSSMTAVNLDPYHPEADRAAVTSDLLQSGGFTDAKFIAAVVRTRVGLMTAAKAVPVSIPNADLGVVYDIRPFLFGNVDGIVGLAYGGLNPASRMPANTWDTKYGPTQLGLGQSAGNLPTLIDQFASAGLITNSFAFSVGRSISSKVDPALNAGEFVLGGGESCTDLFTGSFASVPVLHEAYYHTNLLAIEVGTRSIPVPATAAGDPAVTNAFVDSGNSGIMLDGGLYRQVVDVFSALNPAFGDALKAGSRDHASLGLEGWPDLRLVLQGAGGARVTLTVEPDDYWQLDGYGAGIATCGLTTGTAPHAGQSILGLPLLAGHYVVFDRGTGVMKFAAKPDSKAAPLVA